LYKAIIEVNDLTYEKFKFSYDLNAPQGVRGRSSNNDECKRVLNWEPEINFATGIKQTFDWIAKELDY
jgi:nucleoside-diphosphate-sugar epimerase